MSLQHSPLHERHVAAGAKLAPFGGWEMPLEYPTGVVKEHQAVRAGVGVFDVSHLGKILVRGEGARDLVDASLSNDLGRISSGQAQYTLCCDDGTGGIVDDLIVYLVADDQLLLVPNAANSAEVLRRLQADAPASVDVVDQHTTHAVIAVQGPRSDDLLTSAGLPAGHDYMSFVEHDIDGGTAVVCRTGYTGERGYELVVPSESAMQVWDDLMSAGASYDVVPCGLGARDTLRTEMGYPLHGQDIGPDVDPVTARLGWAVGWKKERFWGRERMLEVKEQGPTRRLSGLVATGRGIPRPHMTVRLTDTSTGSGAEVPATGDRVGEVTSGTFSPTLRKGVALALLSPQVSEGAEVLVDVRGRSEVFTVTKPPFVESHVRES